MSSAVPPASPSTFATFVVAVAAVTGAALLALVLAGPVRAETAPRAEPPTDLRFGEFFRLPIGTRGLELSDTLKAADGREVRLVGYIVAREQGVPGRFLLTPRPVRMSEHADGEADDLPPATVTVLLDPAQATASCSTPPVPLR